MDVNPSPAGAVERKSGRLRLMTLIVATVVVLDQFTKWQVTSSMRLHQSIPIIPDLFSLTYIRNSGAAFGILAGSHAGFRMVFFGVATALALALLGTIYPRLSAGDWVGQASVAAIFGGAVGNLIDRIRGGEVIDFLDFSLMGHHWPAFNVADSAITVGVAFLAVRLFKSKPEVPA
jgi:signal peptidase II